MDPTAATEQFVRQASAPLQGTESAAKAIARVKFTHDAMIDLIIAQPGVSQNEIAKHFGYTAVWISRIVNSDAFQARLALRKNDLVDPSIALSVDERLRAVAARSLDRVLEKLELAPSMAESLDAAKMATAALGYGARQGNLSVQQNFVVALPQKAENANSWASKYSGVPAGLAQMVEDVTPKEVSNG